MSARVHVAILGGSGYGAGELLRLLTQHPLVEVVAVASASRAGQPVEAVHPHLRGFYALRMTESIDLERLLAAEHAVVFSALPHGTSAATIEALVQQLRQADRDGRTRIVDLSGDLRLADAEVHRRYYPDTAVFDALRAQFVYGLPELNRQRIAPARFVANPGCLASAAILAAAPLMTPEFDGPVAIDAKTGSSGSGRALKESTHHPTRHADFRAYRPLAHQHEPEIVQAWGDPAGRRIRTSFVSHSMDAARGIYVTVHLTLPEPVDSATLLKRYASYYEESVFVRVSADPPCLQDVIGSNFCDVSVACRGRQVVAMAALDNLVKGMAGTAVQNMNLMCGLAEETGLWAPGLRPV